MSARYLISKFIDPPFAVLIGASAAFVRVRREERERALAFGRPEPTSTDIFNTITRRLRKVEWNPRKWDWTPPGQRPSGWGMVEPGKGEIGGKTVREMDERGGGREKR